VHIGSKEEQERYLEIIRGPQRAAQGIVYVCSNAPTPKTLFEAVWTNAPQIAPSARIDSIVTVESGRVGSH